MSVMIFCSVVLGLVLIALLVFLVRHWTGQRELLERQVKIFRQENKNLLRELGEIKDAELRKEILQAMNQYPAGTWLNAGLNTATRGVWDALVAEGVLQERPVIVNGPMGVQLQHPTFREYRLPPAEGADEKDSGEE